MIIRSRERYCWLSLISTSLTSHTFLPIPVKCGEQGWFSQFLVTFSDKIASGRNSLSVHNWWLMCKIQMEGLSYIRTQSIWKIRAVKSTLQGWLSLCYSNGIPMKNCDILKNYVKSLISLKFKNNHISWTENMNWKRFSFYILPFKLFFKTVCTETY